jgi:hypothetical protein
MRTRTPIPATIPIPVAISIADPLPEAELLIEPPHIGEE